MLFDIAAVAIGLIILLLGGDYLVRGAVSLALRYGVSPLVVSLTIVALGTSAPELLIGVDSVLAGVPDIAFGNVVGSNIANVLLVLGVPALIAPMDAPEKGSGRTFLFMIVASVLLIVLSFIRPLGITEGIVLLVLFAMFLFDTFQLARSGRQPPPDDVDEADVTMPMPKLVLFILGGIIALPIGADLLVDGAIDIAKASGVSEAVIGLTIVAIGTSLPELATTVAAAYRRESAVAIGNVIGSNLFNILAIMGAASLFGTLPVPDGFLKLDLWVMLFAALALWPTVSFNVGLTRIWGIAFLVLYGVYISVIVH